MYISFISKDTWKFRIDYIYPLQQWKSIAHGDEPLEITHGKVGNGWRTHEHLRPFSPLNSTVQNLQLIQLWSRRRGGIKIYSQFRLKNTKGNISILNAN